MPFRRLVTNAARPSVIVSAIVIVASGLVLASCGSGRAVGALTCPKGEKVVWVSTSPKLTGLTLAQRQHLQNRDNDAGKGRIPDAIADPDVDQSQRRQECVSPNYSPLSPAGTSGVDVAKG